MAVKAFSKVKVFVPCQERENKDDDLSRIFPRIKLIAILRFFHDFCELREAIDLVDAYWDLEARNRRTTYTWRNLPERQVRGIELTLITDDCGVGRIMRAIHGRYPQFECIFESLEELGNNAFAAFWAINPKEDTL